MKITKERLSKIIKEEISKMLKEKADPFPTFKIIDRKIVDLPMGGGRQLKLQIKVNDKLNLSYPVELAPYQYRDLKDGKDSDSVVEGILMDLAEVVGYKWGEVEELVIDQEGKAAAALGHGWTITSDQQIRDNIVKQLQAQLS